MSKISLKCRPRTTRNSCSQTAKKFLLASAKRPSASNSARVRASFRAWTTGPSSWRKLSDKGTDDVPVHMKLHYNPDFLTPGSHADDCGSTICSGRGRIQSDLRALVPGHFLLSQARIRRVDQFRRFLCRELFKLGIGIDSSRAHKRVELYRPAALQRVQDTLQHTNVGKALLAIRLGARCR